MIEIATGLILRTRLLTETSLIVHWLTPTLGRIATVAKGALRPKSPFRGQLDLFYLADLSFDRSTRSNLHTLREVQLRETHAELRRDWIMLQQASYGAQLIEQTTEIEAPVPGIFDLMLAFLGYLVSQPAQPRSVFAFELRLLDQLGLRPDFEQTSLASQTRQLVKELIESKWPELSHLRPARTQVTELGQFLHGFLIYHLGKIPKGRAEALRPNSRQTDFGQYCSQVGR
jgi:DNA repair protein RecO (recombination protein O)